MALPDVGDVAPDFELRDQHNQPIRLSDFHGKRNVVLVFYPFTFTRTCQGELCALRDELHEFEDADAQVLAVSVDSPFAQRRWSEEQELTFPLLADFWPHGAVAQAYGVFDDRIGVAERGTFIIDQAGVIRWRTVTGIPEPRDTHDYRVALASLA